MKNHTISCKTKYENDYNNTWIVFDRDRINCNEMACDAIVIIKTIKIPIKAYNCNQLPILSITQRINFVPYLFTDRLSFFSLPIDETHAVFSIALQLARAKFAVIDRETSRETNERRE